LTDANLVLGRINAERPIGGALRQLDVAAASEALRIHVGDKLGLGVQQAAEAIIRVANAKMAGAIRLVSIERGHDPQRFAFVPFGGGGALHAGALIHDVGMKAALVPRFPGVTSALGCVIADIRHDQVQTVNMVLAGIDACALSQRLHREAEAARAVVRDAGLQVTCIDTLFEADMHYIGQTHTLAVRIENPSHTPLTEQSLLSAFESAYAKNFGRTLPGIGVRVVNLRVAAIGRRPRFDLATLAPGPEASLAAADRGARQIWFGGWREARIYDRLLLPVGAQIPGPAILEQPDATIVVDPGLTARVDKFGNIIMVRA
jgi:N-methylhydantoinase A